MASFFGILIAALIAAMLAPYFSLFLNKEKTKQDEILKYLEEAYLLASKIEPYARQTITHMAFSIAALKGQMTFEQIPKTQEEPFSRLHTLFDFHLNTSGELTGEINQVNNKILWAFRSFAEAINAQNVSEKDKLCIKALSDCTDAAEQAFPIATKIISWIKSEKDKIQSKPTPFEKTYWVNKYNDFLSK